MASPTSKPATILSSAPATTFVSGGYAASSTIGASRVMLPATTAVSAARTIGAPTITSSPFTSLGSPVAAKAMSPMMAQTITSRPMVIQQPTVLAERIVEVPASTFRALDESRIVRCPAVYKGEMPDARIFKAEEEPSMFEGVQVAPPDAILTLATWFKEDKFPQKVNLGIGAYRTEAGKPWPLPSVMAAQQMVCDDPTEDKEYVPIDGKPEHKKFVQQLIFSDAEVASGNIATTQAISGTGSLSMIGQFLSNFMNCTILHIPKPTWGNHTAIFKRAGVTVKDYAYYYPETRGFDFDGMMNAIAQMNPGEAILLHACAQNPTGVDPTPDQWRAIVDIVGQRGLIPVLDNAYQGYASGSLEQDGLSMQLFEAAGLEYFVAQSFAKNFGLYGERIGYIHVRCASKDIAAAVLSQMKILIRQAYSSPPKHGAAIVYKVLSTPELKAQWLSELALMSNRILDMRDALRGAIEAKGTPGTWNHITDQIGMFSYTGLNTAQVERMVNEFHVYMTKDGRISVAGLNPGNVDYVAQCIDTVVREA